MPARRSHRGGAKVKAAQVARERRALAQVQLAGRPGDLIVATARSYGLPGFGCSPESPWRGIIDAHEIRVTVRAFRCEGDALPPAAAELPSRMIELAAREGSIAS